MLRKKQKLVEFIEMRKSGICSYCDMPTYFIGRDYHMNYICTECIDEGEILGIQSDEYLTAKEEEEAEFKKWNKEQDEQDENFNPQEYFKSENYV